MTKEEVIRKIAEEKTVEQIIQNISKKDDDLLNDLAQDIYISLMEKSELLITKLYESNQIRFYITRIVINNIFSKNSPFYTKYKKFTQNMDELTTNIINNEQSWNR